MSAASPTGSHDPLEEFQKQLAGIKPEDLANYKVVKTKGKKGEEHYVLSQIDTLTRLVRKLGWYDNRLEKLTEIAQVAKMVIESHNKAKIAVQIPMAASTAAEQPRPLSSRNVVQALTTVIKEQTRSVNPRQELPEQLANAYSALDALRRANAENPEFRLKDYMANTIEQLQYGTSLKVMAKSLVALLKESSQLESQNGSTLQQDQEYQNLKTKLSEAVLLSVQGIPFPLESSKDPLSNKDLDSLYETIKSSSIDDTSKQNLIYEITKKQVFELIKNTNEALENCSSVQSAADNFIQTLKSSFQQQIGPYKQRLPHDLMAGNSLMEKLQNENQFTKLRGKFEQTLMNKINSSLKSEPIQVNSKSFCKLETSSYSVTDKTPELTKKWMEYVKDFPNVAMTYFRPQHIADCLKNIHGLDNEVHAKILAQVQADHTMTPQDAFALLCQGLTDTMQKKFPNKEINEKEIMQLVGTIVESASIENNRGPIMIHLDTALKELYSTGTIGDAPRICDLRAQPSMEFTFSSPTQVSIATGPWDTGLSNPGNPDNPRRFSSRANMTAKIGNSTLVGTVTISDTTDEKRSSLTPLKQLIALALKRGHGAADDS